MNPQLIKRNRVTMEHACPLLDQISESWARVEAIFREQGILRSTQLAVLPSQSSDAGGQHYIGVRKHHGTWRIACGETRSQSGEVEWTPVADTPISTRIEMLGHIEGLFAEVVKSNEGYLREIRAAATKAEVTLRSIEQNFREGEKE